MGQPCFPSQTEDILLFIVHRNNEGIKLTTIQKELSAIAYLHELWDLLGACKSFLIKTTGKAITRLQPLLQKKAPDFQGCVREAVASGAACGGW